MINLLKEMFSEMVTKKNASLIPKYYHTELVLITNGNVIKYQEFLDSHIKYYSSSIEYRVEYDDSAWVVQKNKLAGRVFITTKKHGTTETTIEVILIVQYKDDKIIRVWEVTYPDWSTMLEFNVKK